MPIAERGVRRRTRVALTQRGYLVDGNPAGPSTGRGRSDLTVCAQGFFFAFEAKAPGELPTPSQLRYLRKVIQAGGVGAVVYAPQDALRIIERTLETRRG